MALALRRPPTPPTFYSSWKSYLEWWSGANEETLCLALAEAYFPLIRAEIEPKRARLHATQTELAGSDALKPAIAELEAQIRNIRHKHLPWLTPVIGSGCLTASDGPDAHDISYVPGQLADVASTWGLLPDGDPQDSVVKAFAWALIRSKVGTNVEPPPSDPAITPSVDRTIAARAALCAHLLSRLYFEVGALRSEPLASITTPLSFDAGAPEVADILCLTVEPLKRALRNLDLATNDGLDAGSRNLAFVSRFIKTVRDDLTSDDALLIRGADAQLMAEITWHFMTEGTQQYPGWTDLLVMLGFAFNVGEPAGNPERLQREARLPHLSDLGQARTRLGVEFDITTTRSWQSRLGNSVHGTTSDSTSDSKRDALYDAVADLLVAQAGLSSPDTSHHQVVSPPAVAFVTSFDLELEMALMQQGVPFRLVVPFYVRQEEQDASAFVWLHTVIVPPGPGSRLLAEDLDIVKTPAEWSLLINDTAQKPELRGIPNVVHLAGCPLISVPDLRSATGSWVQKLRAELGPGAELSGTVLLDEHTALQQWAADFESPKGEKSKDRKLGLHQDLVTGNRFWFLLGVQLNDDAVRHRTAALVGAANRRGGLLGEYPPTPMRRSGVVVNRHSTPSQRDVFLWQGLDVVQATYEKVVAGLRHAARHAADPDSRRLAAEPCTIEDPA